VPSQETKEENVS